MSYGLKYTLTFRDELASNATTGNLWKINIYASGFVGASTAVSASSNPLTLVYNKQDLITPVCGSDLLIGLLSTTNGQYIEFATAAPLAYYVDVLKSTDQGVTYTTFWSGVNTTDCYTEPYSSVPYDIKLKFNCGLGELQWHRYENPSTLISGLEQLIAVVSNCLSFLPYQKNVREIINIREDTMVDTSGLLEQLYMMDVVYTEMADDGILHGINCKQLLTNILTALNCRMYQSNNKWYIERIFERTTTSMTYFDYTPTGVIQNPPYTYSHIGTGSFDPRVNISNSSYPKLTVGGDWAVTQKKPSLAYQFMGGNIPNVDLIVNPYFEDKPTAKNKAGQPLNWDFGASLGAYPMLIEKVNPFTTDPQREWGMDFNAACITAFNSYINGLKIPLSKTSSLFAAGTLGTAWAAHAVRRAGDTYTNDDVYIDVSNGSLDIDLEYYFNFRITPTSSTTITNYVGEASKILGNIPMAQIYVPVMMTITDKNGKTFNIQSNIIFDRSWAVNTQQAGFIQYWLAELNWNFPDLGIQSTPLTAYPLGVMIQNAWNKSTYVDLNFNYKLSYNIPFNSGTFNAGNGIYKFDLKIYPPVIFDTKNKAGTIGTGLTYTTLALNDFAANVTDFQYKDSFQSTSSYTTFYSAADNSSRWNEQKVSVLYGDTLTPGYPGAFRLSTAAPTSTWHHRGLSDTGQILADILFNSYESLIAVYRRAITGKIMQPGGIPFWNNITDEDGTVYAQTGNSFDFKKCIQTINLEEVSAAPASITTSFTGIPKIGTRSFANTASNTSVSPPSFTAAKTPMTSPSMISPSTVNYPSL